MDPKIGKSSTQEKQPKKIPVINQKHASHQSKTIGRHLPQKLQKLRNFVVFIHKNAYELNENY